MLQGNQSWFYGCKTSPVLTYADVAFPITNLAIQMEVDLLTRKFDWILAYKFTASEMVHIYE